MSQVIGCNFGFSGGGTASGTITGGGTVPKVAVFTSPTTIGDGQMSDDGTTVFIGASATSTSAMFEINSTTQGALFPRMTTTQRDAIPVGATEDSLFIFNTSIDKFQFYDTDAGIWQTIESSAIGGETWSQVLTNGATSGGVSPQMSDGDVIRAVNGGGELNLRNGGDSIVSLSTDNGGFAQSYFYGDTTNAEWGYGTSKMTVSSTGAIGITASGGILASTTGTATIGFTNSGTGAINLTTTSGAINLASGTGSWSIAGASSGTLSSSTALNIVSSGNSVNIQAANTNFVGIGTSSPNAKVELVGTTGATSRMIITRYSAGSGGAGIQGRKARGTEGTPTAVQSGDNLFNIAASGYNGSSFTNQSATIIFDASENFTGIANGTEIKFGTTNIGSTSVTEKMTLTANGILGIGNTTPDASSLLEVSSTTQGFLAPRMTAAQRTAIASPATGLWVYQTDGTAGFYYYNGSSWVFNGVGNDGIYGGNGTVPSSTTATVTDTLTFADVDMVTVVKGASSPTAPSTEAFYAEHVVTGNLSQTEFGARYGTLLTNQTVSDSTNQVIGSSSIAAWIQTTGGISLSKSRFSLIGSVGRVSLSGTTGTVNGAVGMRGVVGSDNASQTITHATGYTTNIADTNVGTITNWYGYYMPDQTTFGNPPASTNRWGVYIDDDGYNYFRGSVGIGVDSPDTSSKLDITSTTQGFLAPRMTSAQRIAIASPATGLLVYQTDGTAGFYYYNGSSWVFNGVGTDGIYGGSGTVPSSAVATLTDTITFVGQTILKGANDLATSYTLWTENDSGDVGTSIDNIGRVVTGADDQAASRTDFSLGISSFTIKTGDSNGSVQITNATLDGTTPSTTAANTNLNFTTRDSAGNVALTVPIFVRNRNVTAGSVYGVMVINDCIQSENSTGTAGRTIVSTRNRHTSGAASAVLQAENRDTVTVTTFLVDTFAQNTSQAFAVRSSSTGTGITTTNWQLLNNHQFTHNLGQLSTGDFIMRGLTDVNLFRADASTDRVGIGIAAPLAKLNIVGNGATSATSSLLVENSSLTDLLRVQDDGAIIINETGLSTADVRMEGDTDSNLFFLDASVNRIGFGVGTPTAALHLKAGTATANTAPLKFTTGVLNTTAETGAMEFASDFFYLTANAVRTAISTFGRSVANAATYTALVTDRIIGVTRTTTGTCTVNLPSAALFPDGYQMTIKDEGLNATTNNITIDGSAAQTIDGNLTAIINTDGDSLTIYSNGVDAWFTM